MSSRRRPRARLGCLVIGPHRSGTSALTGVLGHLGVDLGTDLLPPNSANPSGYFELRRIVEAHDALLEALGLAWDEPAPMPPRWWRGEAASRCRDEILEILRAELGESPLWAVKDPRMCRLIPMWRDILQAMKSRPLVVLMLRHPGEVARSLASRDELPAGRSRLLWLDHLLSAEADTRDWPRLRVSYDALLTDWRREVDRIAAAGSIAWPQSPDRQRAKIDRFLSPSLRHHQVAASEIPDSEWTGAVFAAMRRSSDLADPRFKAELTGIRRSVDQALRLFAAELQGVSAPLRNELAEHRAGIDALRRQCVELTEAVSRQRAGQRELEDELERHRVARSDLEAELADHHRRMAELAAELARHQTLRTNLESANRDLSRQADGLRDRGEELAQGQAEQWAARAELERELEARHRDLAALRRDHEAQREELRGQRELVARYAAPGNAFSSLAQRLARREVSRSALQEGLRSVRRQSAGLKQELARYRAGVSALAAAAKSSQAKSRRREREAEEERSRRRGLQGELAGAGRRLEERQQQLDSVLESRSWRITRPLRRLGEMLRRRRAAASRRVDSPTAQSPAASPPALVSSVDLFQVMWDPETGKRALVVSGWCLDFGRSEPVRVSLRSDGAAICSTDCTRSRPDVAAARGGRGRGASPLGCGFDLKVELPAEFDRLELVSSDGTVLAGRSHAELLPAGQLEPYEAFRANHVLRPHVRNVLAEACGGFAINPSFSLVMDLGETGRGAVEATLESLRLQIYDRWELRLIVRPDLPGGPAPLPAAPGGGGRIETQSVERGTGRAAALNAAAEAAGGEFVAFLEPGDRLEPQTLFEIARWLQGDRRADVVYLDHEIVESASGERRPWLKPDWSPALLLGCDYIGPFFFIRRALFRELGGFREGLGVARGHDLLLRAAERSDRWAHLPRLLGSATRRPEIARRPWGAPSTEQAAPVVERALARRSLSASVRRGGDAAAGPDVGVGLEWPDTGPRVTLIVPTYNQHELLRRCVESVMERTSYRDFDLLVVDNGSDSPPTLRYLDGLSAPRVRVLKVPRGASGFSFSAINNRAVRETDSELVLFLNNDTEISQRRWLSRMVGYCRLPGVGAAGARLLYPDGAIQHGGVVLQMNDGLAPGHAFYGHSGAEGGYGGLLMLPREVAAVTAACMLTPRRLFLELGGFDERLPVVLNDVDYCLRLADRGLRSIYVADAVVIHAESRSRRKQDDPSQLVRFKRRYRRRSDPYYNPNLVREPRRSFEVDTACKFDAYRFLERPLRLLVIDASAGAGRGACLPWNGLAALARRGLVAPEIAVAGDPPAALDGARHVYHRLDFARPGAGAEGSAKAQRQLDRELAKIFAERSPDVVMAVGLEDHAVVHAAGWASIPSVWVIPEFHSAQEIDGLAANVPSLDRALRRATWVVFPSNEARILYERFNRRLNFAVLYHALPAGEVDRRRNEVSKHEARERLGLAASDRVILGVGEPAESRDRRTLLEAFSLLAAQGCEFRALLTVPEGGGDGGGFLLGRALARGRKVRRVEAGGADLGLCFQAADIFAGAPIGGLYPVEVLEAMRYGLPVVTTSYCGLAEQVQAGGSAWLVPSRDPDALAEKLAVLLRDEELRRRMGRNGRQVLEFQPSFDEMVERLEHLVAAAWMVGPGEIAENLPEERAGAGREAAEAAETAGSGHGSGVSHRSI